MAYLRMNLITIPCFKKHLRLFIPLLLLSFFSIQSLAQNNSCASIFSSEIDIEKTISKKLVMDVSRTEASTVYFTQAKDKFDLQRLIQYAKQNSLQISLLGTNHSHGGHNRIQDSDGTPKGLQIEMLGMNRIIGLNRARTLVKVEPGVTWKDLSQYLNQYDLAAMTEQSSNIFSIGGSLSTNIHGRDIHGPILRSIESFELLTADGSFVHCSRSANSDLFHAVIGGYGGLGIVSEITLRVQPNTLFRAKVEKDLSINDYVTYLLNLKKKNQNLMHYARVNLTGSNAFQRISLIEWQPTEARFEIQDGNLSSEDFKKLRKLELIEENRLISSMIMNLMRARPTSQIGKKIKDILDSQFGFPKEGSYKTKNQIHNNPVQFLFDNFYNQEHSVDILQEYFLPPKALNAFLSSLKEIVKKNDLNLLNVTFRYIPQVDPKDQSLLSPYSSGSEMVAVVLYFNVIEDTNSDNGMKVSYDGSIWTQQIIRVSQSLGGSFYWPYHRWWNNKQMALGMDKKILEYFKLKKAYDPDNLFSNEFIQALQRTIESKE